MHRGSKEDFVSTFTDEQAKAVMELKIFLDKIISVACGSCLERKIYSFTLNARDGPLEDKLRTYACVFLRLGRPFIQKMLSIRRQVLRAKLPKQRLRLWKSK